jgi:hypothetical protein
MAVKASVEALVGETAKEGEQAVEIVSAWGSKAHGRAVAQDDVGVLGHSKGGRHVDKCRQHRAGVQPRGAAGRLRVVRNPDPLARGWQGGAARRGSG